MEDRFIDSLNIKRAGSRADIRRPRLPVRFVYTHLYYSASISSCPSPVILHLTGGLSPCGHDAHGEEPETAHHAAARPGDDETDIQQTKIAYELTEDSYSIGGRK